ncbi:hypothetical protein DL95DRAFT_512681 [Leptodontidium sp. 2 PMI_412]|nr:hypothetical protein DL95DRAFT_512681 [Leptodontidium sp. 2 PMI_412]
MNTNYKTHLGKPQSTINLAFTSLSVSETCEYFQVNKDICSDHYSLQLHLSAVHNDKVVNPILQIKYNTKLANWELFKKTLIDNVRKSRILGNVDFGPHLVSTVNSTAIIERTNHALARLLDRTTEEFTKVISLAADVAIPRVKPNAKAKSCKYLQAIKSAKREHWNQFLQKEDTWSIFKAMKYTKNNLVSRIPLIKDLLELHNVCSNKIEAKSPGPDGINQEIITHAITTIPDLFFRVYSIFIDLGYHPKYWKTATSAIHLLRC